MTVVYARRKVESLVPYITGLNLPLSYQRRVEASRTTTSVAVTFSERGTALRRVNLRPADFPWEVCNPFKLIHAAAPTTIRQDMEKLWRGIDGEAINPETSTDYLRRVALLSNEADASYYAVYLLCRKIKEGKIPKEKMPLAIEGLKGIVMAAFAEGDVPKIVFVNGYLVQLGRAVPLVAEIEQLYPGMATENLAGTFDHIIRF